MEKQAHEILMEEVLEYLELKNQFYEKFYSVTLKFIEQASQNRWDNIEEFVDNRERILNIIRSFDFKIGESMRILEASGENLVQFKSAVEELIKVRGTMMHKIMDADLDLASRMEDMRNDTIRELKRSLEVSQQVASYSAPTPLKKGPKHRREV